MFLPFLNLWKSLASMLSRTTTDFVVTPPLSTGKLIVQNADGNTAHQVQISTDAIGNAYFGNPALVSWIACQGSAAMSLGGSVQIIRTSNLRLQLQSDSYLLTSASMDWAFGRAAAGIAQVTNGSTGQGQFAGLGMTQLNKTTDAAPTALTFIGGNAYAQSTSHTAGGNVIVTPGCGRRFLTVANFGSIAGGATVTVTVNGVATVLTGGGTNWNSITSNNATATSIATAINASAAAVGVTATAVAAVVYVQVNTGYYATLASSDGTNLAVTSGADGTFTVQATDSNAGHQIILSPLPAGCIIDVGPGATLSVGNSAATGITLGRTSTICTVNSWLQQAAGHKVLNSNATNATNSLANTNLAFTLIAGRSYSIKIKISGGNSTAAEGAQFALTGDGTVTATTMDLEVVGTQGTDVAGTQRVTALASAITFTTFTAPNDVYLVGYFKCGVGGVVTLQIAENSAHVSGTLTLNAGSWIEFNDMVAV